MKLKIGVYLLSYVKCNSNFRFIIGVLPAVISRPGGRELIYDPATSRIPTCNHSLPELLAVCCACHAAPPRR